MDLAEAKAMLAAHHRAKAQAANAFAAAFAANDAAGFRAAYGRLGALHAWPLALRRVAKLPGAHPEMRQLFLAWWVKDGDNIRDEINGDRHLLDALRVLLPPYAGPALVLYRGDSMFNRKHRSYGAAWSADREIAEAFALGDWRHMYAGGSVLLRTIAPPDAIVCAVHGSAEDCGEAEYIVDRRRLGRVEVVQRYANEGEASLLNLVIEPGADPADA